jgi:hypothetical protein
MRQPLNLVNVAKVQHFRALAEGEISASVPRFHPRLAADIFPIVRANVKRESQLMRDEARHYKDIGGGFASHDAVNHSKDEYARYDGDRVTTRLKVTIRSSSAA